MLLVDVVNKQLIVSFLVDYVCVLELNYFDLAIDSSSANDPVRILIFY